mgnify:CR=1 FL=1
MSQRLEHDTFGPIAVPAERLWGAQTQRSLEHFAISSETMPPELIRALALVKQAAAQVRIGFRIGSAIERGRIAHLGNTQRRIDRQRDGPRGHIGGGPRLQRARKSADLCFTCW